MAAAPSFEAGQMKRSSIQACELARARRSASSASDMSHRGRREQRRVVDQAAEQSTAGVAAHAGGIELRLAGHSRALPA